MTSSDQQPSQGDMQQENKENAKGWQIQVDGGTANNADTINIYNNCPRKIGVPFQAPPLPRPYIERPEIQAAVKAKLLEEETTTPGTLVVSAIYGLGGIGKSVLATVLAYDSEVQARFPDGILWATLGQQPDVLPFLSSWIQALGDYDYKPTTIEAATLHLRTLLYDKRSLVVVDDLWNPDDLEPFRVGGMGCRVVVTTREAKIPDADRYDMDVMTPEQSLELLLQKAQCGEPTVEERQQAAALAATVGYLPLALELAGAQIADGVVSWDELLEDLQAEVARLETLDDSTIVGVRSEKNLKRLSLVASFNLSLRLLSPEQLRQFAWLGVLPEDVVMTQAMAATLWQVTPRQAGVILHFLWSKALLLPGVRQPGQKPTYRLHDLMHELAKRLLTAVPSGGYNSEIDLPGLGLTLVAAQQEFLARYQARTAGRQWHTLPDDGYIHAHLTWHLEQAQQLDVLHELLQETTAEGRNGWYEACERLGQTANFVTDVARAWELAERQYGENPAQSIGLQIRYALITTTLNSLANKIPPKLMAALVKEGRWSPEQGLAYARQVKDSERRTAIISALAAYLPKTLFPVALELVRSIENNVKKVEALSKLAPYLPEVIPEAWQITCTIQDEPSYAEALSKLAPYMPEVAPEAWQITRTIQVDPFQSLILSDLAPYLPKSLLPQVLQVVRAIQDEFFRAFTLSQLAPYLQEPLLSEAFQIARAIQNKQNRVLALRGLVPHCSKVIFEAFQIARTVESETSRTETLSSLAPCLPESLLLETFQIICDTEDESSRAEGLSKLASHLPESLLLKACQVARAIQDEFFRAEALSGLALYVPEVTSEALQLAYAIQDKSSRAKALSGLAPYVPEVIPEALQLAYAIQDESSRADVLSELALCLPEVIADALQAARTIQNEFFKAMALKRLAPYLPQVIPEVLSLVRSIKHETTRAKVLSKLVPYLPEELLLEVLVMVRTIENECDRAKLLGELAPYLPQVIPEALAIVRTIEDDCERAKLLIGLVPYLPEVLPEVSYMALTFYEKSPYDFVVSGLAPYLLEVLPELLAMVQDVQNSYPRAVVLSELVPYLPEPLVPKALAMVRDIPDDYSRSTTLKRLLDRLDLTNFELWREALHTLASLSRREFLECLPKLSPAILALVGRVALEETVVAMREVCQQWQ